MSAPQTIHGCALVLGEQGLLIRGASGAGKSSLVLALIEAAAARGLFARLVADDRVQLAVAGGRLLAAPHPAIAGQIEERGRGIRSQLHEQAVRITLIVDLVEVAERLPEAKQTQTELGGISLPRLSLPSSLPSESAARRILGFF